MIFEGGDETDSELDAAIERSFADLHEGRIKPAEEVFDRLEQKYRRMAADRANRSTVQGCNE